ncbi:MAG TPA: fused MFS/spermidine synthase, partial [Opitutus sp.]|nr:fused MFS/spermidine synthase [Opitutus sp.]
RLAGALLLIPMALLGVGLPAIMERAGRVESESTSRLLGQLLAVNVLGSVAGALLAGFLLPKWLGLWGGIMWLGGLLLLAGLWQSVGQPRSALNRKFGFVLAAGWLASSVALVNVDLPRVRLNARQNEKLLSVAEGAHGITAVVERDGARRMKLNNFYGLGGTKATADERMQAHLPLLLHPAPKRVAFLGMGTGITAGGALFHPIEQVTIMELVPEVVAAAREYFSDANQGVLDDVRSRVITDDARHFLRGSGERFDVIVGDLVVPWRQGEGSLFTLEQFAAARGALNPDGLFCQWLPLFQLSEVELNILIRTFLAVFPQAEVWRGDFWPDEPAIALVGRPDDFAIDADAIQKRLMEMKPDPTNPHLRAPGIFWMHRVGVLRAADLPDADRRLNREDLPWIELLGPMLHAGGNKEQLFTGRKLQAWLNEVGARASARSPELPALEAGGVVAGKIFTELVLCLAENNSAGADAAQERLRQALPESAYRQLMFR